MKLHRALILTLLLAPAASAAETQTDSLNNLFDGVMHAAAPLTSFTPGARSIPNEVGTPVFQIMPKTSLLPRQESNPINIPQSRELLLNFIERHGSALTSIAGVRALSVGLDCLDEGSHRHLVAHKPVIMIAVDAAANQDLIRRQMLRQVPQLSQVPFQIVAFRPSPAKNKSFLN